MTLNRRRFVKMVGGGSLLGAASSRVAWASEIGRTLPPRFAYVGTQDEVQVYSITADGRFIAQQSIAASMPVAMAIGRNHLYVVNGVSEFQNRPRGSVQVFSIDPATGTLKEKNRVALSLSAIAPRDLAIAPDGRHLVVAIHGGGAYNLLPIHEDGRLGRVSAILKETGSGPHSSQTSAHPSAVVFDRAGRLLAADHGADTLSVISVGRGELAATNRCEVSSGSGPGCVAIHPSGKCVYVAHALSGSIDSFAYDRTQGRIGKRVQTIRLSNPRSAKLVIHPSGKFLFATDGDSLEMWTIAADGALNSRSEIPNVRATRLHVTAEGKDLLALNEDAILKMRIDADSGKLGAPVEVASHPIPVSLITW